MARMTGGGALVEMLRRHGIDTLFALPGVQNDALFVALYDAGEAIRVIHPRHEQAAASMALGYARASGKVGAYAVVPGPGVLNPTSALATGYATNAPVLCISGQIPSTLIGRGFGLLHEVPDQLAILRGLTKWAARISHPSETGKLVNEAFRQLADGRPRPAALEMPLDIMPLDGQVARPTPGSRSAPASTSRRPAGASTPTSRSSASTSTRSRSPASRGRRSPSSPTPRRRSRRCGRRCRPRSGRRAGANWMRSRRRRR